MKKIYSERTMANEILEDPNYRPDYLLSYVLKKLHLRSDADIARALEIDHSLLCRIRTKKQCLSAETLIRIHEATGDSIGDLREKMGLPRNILHYVKRGDSGVKFKKTFICSTSGPGIEQK